MCCGIGCVCVCGHALVMECVLCMHRALGPVPLVCMYMRMHTSTCVHNDKA